MLFSSIDRDCFVNHAHTETTNCFRTKQSRVHKHIWVRAELRLYTYYKSNRITLCGDGLLGKPRSSSSSLVSPRALLLTAAASSACEKQNCLETQILVL